MSDEVESLTVQLVNMTNDRDAAIAAKEELQKELDALRLLYRASNEGGQRIVDDLRNAKETAERERDALRVDKERLEKFLDWTETLLCNSLPMPHCSQEEWDKTIQSWREQKHNTNQLKTNNT